MANSGTPSAHDSTGPNREALHSRFNRVLAVLSWLIDAVLVASGVISGAIADHPQLLVAAALVGLAAWVGLWHPGVIVDDDAVTLVNVLSSVVVPWAALIDVDTKYALTLRTPGHAWSAWAAPAPGRAGVAVARRREQGNGRRSSGATSRPGDLLATESGLAAHLVRERWQELHDANRIEAGVADETPVQRRWHVGYIAALVALAVGSVFALGWV